MFNAVTKAMQDAERDAVREVVGRALRILEDGDLLGHGWMCHLSDEQRQRLRVLRQQICERDLYELIYGELPPNAVNPDDKYAPDFDSARASGSSDRE